MSHTLRLRNPTTHQTAILEEKYCDGEYCVKYAEFEITDKHHPIFDKMLPPVDPPSGYESFVEDGGKLRGIRTIYGMTGFESIPVLEVAMVRLARSGTCGDVEQALMACYLSASYCPDSIWDGD